MEYSSGYPCLYGLSAKSLAIERNGKMTGVIKNGSTWYIAQRKSAAITYMPELPYYTYIIVLQKNSFEDKSDLYTLDAEFVRFIKEKSLGEYYIKEGGGSEWFDKSCPVDYLNLRLEFLKEKKIEILKVLHSDPFPTRPLEEIDENHFTALITEEHARKKKHTESLFEKFCRCFLQGKNIRRIQTELWKAFSDITNKDEDVYYKGIVQWPTGCGKTIAILMMVILAKEYCQKKGIIYRGLFVSPKNDIIDTISSHFNKLHEFGIEIYDGSNARLSKLTIPVDKHCIVMACHSALLNENGMKSLPPMKHIHYDEVHRITGDIYFNLLKEMMEKWKTNFLTGTSATPKTSSAEQHKKLEELFGNPYTILHKCDVSEAVEEGWIARPRFHVRLLQKNKDRATILEAFVHSAVELVLQKGRGGKNIFYIETSKEDVFYAVSFARKKYPSLSFYCAIDEERTDDLFLSMPVCSTPHILFACQRYREGSDIPGLEITGKLVGDSTAAHNLIQISGRALRIDYTEKEGWCLIARPSEDGTTVEDVLDSIVLDIIDYLGDKTKSLPIKEVEKLVKAYFGELNVEGNQCSLKETVERIQAAYLRIQFSRKSPKERYSLLQSYNIEMSITSKYEYLASRESHPRFIEKPEEYFKDCWICWYHFLGFDIGRFPQTKADWIRVCKERGIQTWDQYRQIQANDLPINPSEMYPEYSNWDSEFGVEEEIIF